MFTIQNSSELVCSDNIVYNKPNIIDIGYSNRQVPKLINLTNVKTDNIYMDIDDEYNNLTNDELLEIYIYNFTKVTIAII